MSDLLAGLSTANSEMDSLLTATALRRPAVPAAPAGGRCAGLGASEAARSMFSPERDLLNAVSLLQANLNGARLLGPLLAAPLLITEPSVAMRILVHWNPGVAGPMIIACGRWHTCRRP